MRRLERQTPTDNDTTKKNRLNPTPKLNETYRYTKRKFRNGFSNLDVRRVYIKLIYFKQKILYIHAFI